MTIKYILKMITELLFRSTSSVRQPFCESTSFSSTSSSPVSLWAATRLRKTAVKTSQWPKFRQLLEIESSLQVAGIQVNLQSHEPESELLVLDERLKWFPLLSYHLRVRRGVLDLDTSFVRYLRFPVPSLIFYQEQNEIQRDEFEKSLKRVFSSVW